MPAAMKMTLYQILGIEPTASAEEVAAAHRKRIQELSVAAIRDPNRLVVLNQAKEILSDPNQRAAYDASLTRPAEARTPAAEPTFLESWGKWIALGTVALGVAAWFATRGPAPPPEVAPPLAEVTPDASEPVHSAEEQREEPLPENPAPAAAGPAEAAEATVAPASEDVHPIVGAWYCFDPVSGLGSDYRFGADGILIIESTGGGRQSYKYTVSGRGLKLADAEKARSLTIEDLTGRQMILNTGAEGRRLVCTR
jgi:hypothetical protein